MPHGFSRGRGAGIRVLLGVGLEYSDDVTVDTFTYTGADGNDVTVDQPATGWSTTISFTGPMDFCFLVSGAMGPSGGSVSVTRNAAVDSGPGSGFGQSTYTVSGADVLAYDGCVPYH